MTQNNQHLTCTSPQHYYSAYGLTIRSDIPLPELIPTANRQADISICFGAISDLSDEDRQAYRYIQANPNQIDLAWDGVGAFRVRNGHKIIVDPAPEADEALLRLFLLGTTLAMLLHQRGGTAVLHASVVAINGQAIGFIGEKGAGKSTMAATLQAHGHQLVADDILVVDLDSKYPMALPGFPHFKLWPDSIASLGHIPEALPKLRPELEKRGYRLRNGFAQTPVPLKQVYVLDYGESIKVERLPVKDSLGQLMTHWYGARFGTDVLEALGLANHFLQCANLANKIPVCLLQRPASFTRISEVIQTIENNLPDQLILYPQI